MIVVIGKTDEVKDLLESIDIETNPQAVDLSPLMEAIAELKKQQVEFESKVFEQISELGEKVGQLPKTFIEEMDADKLIEFVNKETK